MPWSARPSSGTNRHGNAPRSVRAFGQFDSRSGQNTPHRSALMFAKARGQSAASIMRTRTTFWSVTLHQRRVPVLAAALALGAGELNHVRRMLGEADLGARPAVRTA